MNINDLYFDPALKKLADEESLLAQIQMVSTRSFSEKCKHEFHCKYHAYDFSAYLVKLQQIRDLLCRGLSQETSFKVVQINAYNFVINNIKASE